MLWAYNGHFDECFFLPHFRANYREILIFFQIENIMHNKQKKKMSRPSVVSLCLLFGYYYDDLLPQLLVISGPLVNSEFYPGWFTVWGQKGQTMPKISAIIASADYMYTLGASFNFYMVHGGTNFDFWNGAKENGPVI